MMELTFSHNVADLPAMLSFNYDELKKGLEDYLSRFRDMVVTEGEIRQAEADRASINKTRDAIRRARIDIKRRAFDEFEGKAKELECMCAEAAEGIDAQIKAFDERRAATKRAEVEALVRETLAQALEGSGVSPEAEPWAKFVEACWTRPRGSWRNSGTTLESIREEVLAEADRVKREHDTLVSFLAAEDIDVRTVGESRFAASFSLNETLAYLKSYKEQAALVAQAREKEEAAKSANAPAQAPAQAPAGGGRVETYRLEITGTRDALAALRRFGEAHGVKFRNLGR